MMEDTTNLLSTKESTSKDKRRQITLKLRSAPGPGRKTQVHFTGERSNTEVAFTSGFC